MQRPLAFSDLINPLTPQQFFDEYQGKTAVQLPGRRRRFAPMFSWDEFNRLLNMTTVWSDTTMKVVLDGRELTPKEFCLAVRSREGHNVMQPDPKRLKLFLEQGATIVLDLAERLSEGLAAIADTLQAALGAPVSCNIYCSWEQHRGFPAHFDTMDVFALQIDGEKTWQLYEGRFENPVERPGYNYSSLPRSHHEDAKGALLGESVMTPGDVLYIPRGQYHEALASRNASLHLSFGVTEATGQDFLNILINSLSDDALFRAPLPHFDNPKAHLEHLQKFSHRLAETGTGEDSSHHMRDYQRRRAMRTLQPNFALPERGIGPVFRVRIVGMTVSGNDTGRVIECDGELVEVDAEHASIIDWIQQRNLFSRAELEQSFPVMTEEGLHQLLETLTAARLISPV